MIIYCGLRHFYLQHFQQHKPDTYYILTHNQKIWDFSPELKEYGLNNQANLKTILQLEKPVETIAIELEDFQHFSTSWHNFSRQYTSELEPEYPHAWYLRFRQQTVLEQFMQDFQTKANKLHGGICGGGASKLIAKLAAHNLSGGKLIKPNQTKAFLNHIPLSRLPLPEMATLQKLGLRTIGELADFSYAELGRQFGQRAEFLQQLGQGLDPVPFRAERDNYFTWKIDCTTLAGFLRPLTACELKPYLKQGLEELFLDLKAHSKIAGNLILEGKTVENGDFTAERHFKKPGNDPNMFLRAVEGIMPQANFLQLEIILKKLQPASPLQLNMFAEPISFQLNGELQAERGIELSRRERLLLLWEEHFRYE